MKTLRRKSLVALFIALVACLTMVFALSFRTASADVVEPDKDLFTMEEGASVALTQDGLRFRVKMGENVYAKIVTEDTDKEVSLSVLVAPKTLFDAVSNGAYLNLSKSVKIEIEDESKIYLYDGYYWANAVLTNLNADNNAAITESQFDLSFAAIGVIEQDGTAPVYATFAGNDIANNTRNQYDVITAAVLDVEDAEQATALLDSESPYASWFGGEDYPIVIDTVEKYNALTAQITNGVNFTANIEVQNKFDIPEDNTVELPATAKKIHYVSFYNDSELLETVEVVDGESAACSKTVPAYKALDAKNGKVTGYKNNGWVANNGSALDLSAVYANAEAKINWVLGDHTNALKEDAIREEPNTLLFFDREVGVSQLSMTGGPGAADGGIPFESSFDTNVKWKDERGSTKLYFENVLYNGNVANPWINLSPAAFSANDGDWVAFYAYFDFTSEIKLANITYSNTPGVRIINGEWGLIMLPVNNFGNHQLRIELNGANTTSSGSIYFSKAVIIPANEAVDLTKVADGDTWKIGNTTLVNKVSTESYSDISTKGNHDKTPNDYVYTQDFNYSPFMINGEIFYYHQWMTDGSIYLTFADTISGKLYITGRGLANAPKIYMWDADGELISGSATVATISNEDAGNGYKTYCFDLGTSNVKTIRFHTGHVDDTSSWFRQIAINDITVGA